MNLSLPDPLIEGITLTEKDILFDLAIGLYVDRRATLGQAARLAGLSRPAFLDALGKRQVSIHYDEADLASDLQTLQDLKHLRGWCEVRVVSDTTAITSLLKLDKVELLQVLFGKVMIPSAVQAELLSYHRALPAWLIVQAVPEGALSRRLTIQLDAGEMEAIILAKTIDADILLIDEKRGRVIAEHLGVRCLGLAGALLLAKQRGLIPSLGDMLDHLENEANFYLAAGVKHKLLAAAGETLWIALQQRVLPLRPLGGYVFDDAARCLVFRGRVLSS